MKFISLCNSFFAQISRSFRWCVRHRNLTLGLILLLGLGLRLIRYRQELLLSRDSYGYLIAAEQLARSGDWSAIFQLHAYSNLPPGFFWLLMGGIFCGIDPAPAGMFWVFWAGLALIAAAYWAVLGFSNRTGYALVAALIAATNPALIRLGSSILRDVPYFACVLIAVGAGIWAVRTQKFRYWLLFVPAAICAMLLRKEGFELMIMVAAWCAFALPAQLYRRNWRGVGFVLSSSVFALGMPLLPLLPLEYYLAANHQSQWEVIPHTWIGYIWSMFNSALRR